VVEVDPSQLVRSLDLCAVSESVSCRLAAAPFNFKTFFGETTVALQSHWLDEVVKNCRDADSVLQAISKSAKLRTAIEEGVRDADEQEEMSKTNPVCGPFYEQVVRVAIVNAVSDDE